MYSKRCENCRKVIKYRNNFFFQRHLHLCQRTNEGTDNTYSICDDVEMNDNIHQPTLYYEDDYSIDSDDETTSSVGIEEKPNYEYINKNHNMNIYDYNTSDSLSMDSTKSQIFGIDNDILHQFYEVTDSSSDVNNDQQYESFSSISSNEIIDDKKSDIIHPFEAKSLKFFRDNNIPISLFKYYIELFEFGIKTNYSPPKAPSYMFLLNQLKDSNQFRRHQYRTKKLNICQGISLKVRVFPFVENIKWLLQQEDLMNNALWEYNSSTTKYSEMNTGYWWKKAEESMLERTRNSYHDHPHVLIPVIPFIDKTHCSNKGTLHAEPVLISIGNIPLKERKKEKAWFNLGFIPTKLMSGAERELLKKGPGTRATVSKVYHMALEEIFDELINIEQDDYISNSGIKLYAHGIGYVYAHFDLSMIIGDAVGHDQLCCHYQGYSSELKRPMRMCTCSYKDLDNDLVLCKPVVAANIEKIILGCINAIHDNSKKTEAREVAKSLSQDLHISSLSKFYFGGDEEGVFGATPVESLHALLFGPMKMTLLSLFEYKFDYMTKSKDDETNTVALKKVFRTAEFERRIRILSKLSKRQSYRHIPRSTYSNGVSSISGLSAQELIGLSMLTIVALPGCIDIDSKDLRLSIEQDFTELLWLGVSLYKCFNCTDIDKDKELILLETKVRYYIRRFCQVCGEQRYYASLVGTKLPKLHSLIHLVLSIRKFGVPNNYFGGFLESMMKTFVKYPSKRTRLMTGDTFLEDMSNRWSEFSIIDEYYSTTILPNINQSTIDYTPVPEDIEASCKWGMERFRFTLIKKKWHTAYKDSSGSMCYNDRIFHPFYKLPDKVLHALSDWVQNDSPRFFDGIVPAYISCHYYVKDKTEEYQYCDKEDIIFRSSPSYQGEPWFDWISIEYEDENNPDNKFDVPTKSFLWLKVCYERDDIQDPEFVLGWPLDTMQLPQYPYLCGLGYDNLWYDACVFPKELVRGPAFVLPAVDIDNVHEQIENDLPNEMHENVLPNEISSIDLLHSSKYIFIPFRNKWKSIGWDSSVFKKFQKEWIEIISNIE